jgi:hypothetical protein
MSTFLMMAWPANAAELVVGRDMLPALYWTCSRFSEK